MLERLGRFIAKLGEDMVVDSGLGDGNQTAQQEHEAWKKFNQGHKVMEAGKVLEEISKSSKKGKKP